MIKLNLFAIRETSRHKGFVSPQGGHSVCFECVPRLRKGLFLVYRLEEDGSLLKEGVVRLSLGALRACSYKNEAEA